MKDLAYDMRDRFRVTTTALNPNAQPVVVYDGHNGREARRVAQFWDERGDTWYEELRVPDSALGRAMHKFDQLIRWLQTSV